MPRKNTTQVGAFAETLAADFLVQQGYQILARNYTYDHAEIDIIAQKNNIVVFVEVKMRSSTAFGMPEKFVTPQKQNLILKAASHYIFENNIQTDIRFDIIAILWLQEKPEFEHFEDAFY